MKKSVVSAMTKGEFIPATKTEGELLEMFVRTQTELGKGEINDRTAMMTATKTMLQRGNGVTGIMIIE